MNRDDNAHYAVEQSIPLETVADPGALLDGSRDLNLKIIDDALRELLLEPQQGARQVAKTLFQRVSDVRGTQFSAVALDRIEGDTSQVFQHYPSDRGHLGVPYYEHILRGLRTEAPTYVLDVLADQPVQARSRISSTE